jgi:hypothetical protein
LKAERNVAGVKPKFCSKWTKPWGKNVVYLLIAILYLYAYIYTHSKLLLWNITKLKSSCATTGCPSGSVCETAQVGCL